MRGLQVELPGDLLVRGAADDQGGDLPLLRCQLLPVVVAPPDALAAGPELGAGPLGPGPGAEPVEVLDGVAQVRPRLDPAPLPPEVLAEQQQRPAPVDGRAEPGQRGQTLLVVLRRDIALGEQAAAPVQLARDPGRLRRRRPGLEGREGGQRPARLADPDGRLDQVRRAAEHDAGVTADGQLLQPFEGSLRVPRAEIEQGQGVGGPRVREAQPVADGQPPDRVGVLAGHLLVAADGRHGREQGEVQGHRRRLLGLARQLQPLRGEGLRGGGAVRGAPRWPTAAASGPTCPAPHRTATGPPRGGSTGPARRRRRRTRPRRPPSAAPRGRHCAGCARRRCAAAAPPGPRRR